MKYIGRKGWVRGLAILVLSCILLQNTGTAFAKSPNAKSIKSSALGAKRAKKLKGNASQSSGKQQVIIGEGTAHRNMKRFLPKYNIQVFLLIVRFLSSNGTASGWRQ